MRYHLTPVRMAIIEKIANNNVGEDVEKREPLYTHGGNANWCSHYGKQYGGFSKNEKENYHRIQQFHSWVFIQKNPKTLIRKDTCTPTFTAALFTIANIWKQPKVSINR